MVHEVILPRLGTNIDTGTVAGWKKAEGDPVKKGEVLMEVETSKAVFAVEAERNGFMKRILYGEGESVPFTAPVALMTDLEDENVSDYFKERPEVARPRRRHHDLKREELSTPGPVSAPETPSVPRHEPGARPAATPAARRVLRESGVDVATVAESTGERVVDEETARRFVAGKQVAVYGAGLGVKQISEIMRFHPNLAVKGLFDDDPAMTGREVAGHPVLGGWDELEKLASKGEVESVVITLHSEHRRKVHERIRESLPFVEMLTLVDPRATLSGDVRISAGALVEAGSVIGPDTYIGEGAILDLGSIVCHDCHIGAHCHLSPGSVISGAVRLEENVLVGVGASVNSQVTVGRNVVITPGSAVVTDVPPDVVISGNPASVIGKSFRGGKEGGEGEKPGAGEGRKRARAN